MKLKNHLTVGFLCLLLICLSCNRSSIETTKMLVSGPDKELVAALKQQAKADSMNRTPEQREARKQQLEENAQEEEMRLAAIEQMRENGVETAEYYDDELDTGIEGEIPPVFGILFVVLILAGFAFLFWWTVIRKIRNKFRDISYVKGEVLNKMDDIKNDPKYKQMSDEERKSINKTMEFLNGNQK